MAAKPKSHNLASLFLVSKIFYGWMMEVILWYLCAWCFAHEGRRGLRRRLWSISWFRVWELRSFLVYRRGSRLLHILTSCRWFLFQSRCGRPGVLWFWGEIVRSASWLRSWRFCLSVWGDNYHFYCNYFSVGDVFGKFYLSVGAEPDGDMIVLIAFQNLEPSFNHFSLLNIIANNLSIQYKQIISDLLSFFLVTLKQSSFIENNFCISLKLWTYSLIHEGFFGSSQLFFKFFERENKKR